MHPLKSLYAVGLAAGVVLCTIQSAHAGFVDYVIRNTPTIISGPPIEFIIDSAGDKAGLGSNDINGQTLGAITSLGIDRLDDRTRFTPGSGPHAAPYLNFWITDGAGRYAVVANEPTDGNFQPLYSNGYDLTFADLSDKAAKIFETTDLSWLPNMGVELTFADLAGFLIQAPTAAEFMMGWGGLGSGAPRELGTNVAYGVNWIFGDTLANYVSGEDGYIVDNARVAAAVPEPGALALFGLGLVGLGLARRRKTA